MHFVENFNSLSNHTLVIRVVHQSIDEMPRFCEWVLRKLQVAICSRDTFTTEFSWDSSSVRPLESRQDLPHGFREGWQISRS